MGAIAREASNCSRKFEPQTAARQPSYPQIFPRSQRCVALPTPSAKNVTDLTFSSTMLASARAALAVSERPARTATSCALLSTTSPDFRARERSADAGFSRTLTLHVETSSFPNENGTNQERII